jgi:hypothetical protein
MRRLCFPVDWREIGRNSRIFINQILEPTKGSFHGFALGFPVPVSFRLHQAR